MPLLGKCKDCETGVVISSLTGVPGGLYINYNCPKCKADLREVISLEIPEIEPTKPE